MLRPHSVAIHSFVSLIVELEELKALQKSNTRRDDRLARVRTKNFQKKEVSAQQEFSDTRKKAVSQAEELQVIAHRT